MERAAISKKTFLIIESRQFDNAFGFHTRETLEEARTVARHHVEADASGVAYDIYELVKVGQMVRQARWEAADSSATAAEQPCESTST